jgi:hypothetical protein
VETCQDIRLVREWQAQVWATALRRPLSALLKYPARLDPPEPASPPRPPRRSYSEAAPSGMP